MPISLNCSQGNVVKPNFKGSFQKSENGIPYYKTNAGTVAGSVMAVPAALTWLINLNAPTTKEELEKKSKNMLNMFMPKNISAEEQKAINEGLKESMKDSEKQLEYYKTMKRRAIPGAIIAAGLTLGCGILVDYLRNKKAQASADFVKQVGMKNAFKEDRDLVLSNSGRAYYKSNQGKKYGFGLGAICGVAAAALAHSKHNPNSGAAMFISNIISFGLGGLLMGTIADHNANSDARKHA